MHSLPEEYRHEPELALAAGDDGLDLVRIMLKEARQYLTDDGLLVLEVGNSWPALVEAYPQLPFVFGPPLNAVAMGCLCCRRATWIY